MKGNGLRVLYTNKRDETHQEGDNFYEGTNHLFVNEDGQIKDDGVRQAEEYIIRSSPDLIHELFISNIFFDIEVNAKVKDSFKESINEINKVKKRSDDTQRKRNQREKQKEKVMDYEFDDMGEGVIDTKTKRTSDFIKTYSNHTIDDVKYLLSICNLEPLDDYAMWRDFIWAVKSFTMIDQREEIEDILKEELIKTFERTDKWKSDGERAKTTFETIFKSYKYSVNSIGYGTFIKNIIDYNKVAYDNYFNLKKITRCNELIGFDLSDKEYVADDDNDVVVDEINFDFYDEHPLFSDTFFKEINSIDTYIAFKYLRQFFIVSVNGNYEISNIDGEIQFSKIDKALGVYGDIVVLLDDEFIGKYGDKLRSSKKKQTVKDVFINLFSRDRIINDFNVENVGSIDYSKIMFEQIIFRRKKIVSQTRFINLNPIVRELKYGPVMSKEDIKLEGEDERVFNVFINFLKNNICDDEDETIKEKKFNFLMQWIKDVYTFKKRDCVIVFNSSTQGSGKSLTSEIIGKAVFNLSMKANPFDALFEKFNIGLRNKILCRIEELVDTSIKNLQTFKDRINCDLTKTFKYEEKGVDAFNDVLRLNYLITSNDFTKMFKEDNERRFIIYKVKSETEETNKKLFDDLVGILDNNNVIIHFYHYVIDNEWAFVSKQDRALNNVKIEIVKQAKAERLNIYQQFIKRFYWCLIDIKDNKKGCDIMNENGDIDVVVAGRNDKFALLRLLTKFADRNGKVKITTISFKNELQDLGMKLKSKSRVISLNMTLDEMEKALVLKNIIDPNINEFEGYNPLEVKKNEVLELE